MLSVHTPCACVGAFPPSDFNNPQVHAPQDRAEPANPTSCISDPHSSIPSKGPTTPRHRASTWAGALRLKLAHDVTTVAVMLVESTTSPPSTTGRPAVLTVVTCSKSPCRVPTPPAQVWMWLRWWRSATQRPRGPTWRLSPLWRTWASSSKRIDDNYAQHLSSVRGWCLKGRPQERRRGRWWFTGWSHWAWR